MKVRGWDCKDGTPEEDHDWQLRSDSEGDCNVINGTRTIYWMQCAQCDKEREPTDKEIEDGNYADYDDEADFI